MTPELTRFVRQEVQRQLNVILSGSAGTNATVESEDIQNLYPGSPQISQRPVMHPCGFASRAPAGTIQVNAKQGADAQNRMVLGHRDTMRKQLTLGEGEAVIYGSDGKTVLSSILVSNTQGVVGTIGPEGALSFTKGEVEFTASLVQLFNDIAAAVTLTMIGSQPLIMPTFEADLAKLQTFVAEG
jgi:phage gp45-like